MSSDELIKQTLESAKTIAMVGVSSVKKEVSTNIRRRPSTIVMKYMQEFGYKVIPVNPFSVGEKVHGETIVGKGQNWGKILTHSGKDSVNKEHSNWPGSNSTSKSDIRGNNAHMISLKKSGAPIMSGKGDKDAAGVFQFALKP